MKTNYEKTYSYAFVRTLLPAYVNTRSLALAMFVAVALQGTMRGNESEKTALTKSYAQPGALSQGSLEVYSGTDEFSDGDLLYYAHSSYAIYTRDGKLFKNVENHMSRSDENPATVSLPVGSYTVVARSAKDGYVGVPVMINAGRRTVLALE